MNNKAILPLILLISYIAFFTGMVALDVGKPSSGEIYITSWDTVFTMFVILTSPAMLAFGVGKNYKNDAEVK